MTQLRHSLDLLMFFIFLFAVSRPGHISINYKANPIHSRRLLTVPAGADALHLTLPPKTMVRASAIGKTSHHHHHQLLELALRSSSYYRPEPNDRSSLR